MFISVRGTFIRYRGVLWRAGRHPFFFFSFFFEVIHCLLRLQVNRLQNDKGKENVVFSLLRHC